MEQRHQYLIKQGDDLFGKRSSLLSYWQEVADNFYPERADFTTTRSLGEDFASNLDTSYPVLARRDLGNAFSSMLRNADWFEIGTADDIEKDDEAANAWLEAKTAVQRRAMYDKDAQFMRATKEGDHDYAAFGQCVISVEMYSSPDNGQQLLYRSWHLRDCAWGETIDGKTLPFHRKWQATATELKTQFPNTIHKDVEACLEKEPFKKFNVRHIVVRASDYEGKYPGKGRTPYVSIFIDVDNETVLEERGSWTKIYTVPRWQTVSGSQYAYSPATVAALPDARLLQAMTFTLLTAGENAVNPPLVGVQDAIRSDLNVFPGGFTAVDAEYDERLGEVLRPLVKETRSLPIGFEMIRDSRSMLAEAFFLNRLNLPQPTGDMTAYEVSQRIQEYIRAALPLFEPMEADYNGSICEDTFTILMRNGAFGPAQAMPESLSSAQIQFQFVSPIKEATERAKGDKLVGALGLVQNVAPLDPMAPAIIDARTALRDALHGIGVESRWLRSEDQVDEIAISQQEQQQAQALLDSVSQGAEIAEKVGGAAKAMDEGFAGMTGDV
jgi:hypothetical protein